MPTSATFHARLKMYSDLRFHHTVRPGGQVVAGSNPVSPTAATPQFAYSNQVTVGVSFDSVPESAVPARYEKLLSATATGFRRPFVLAAHCTAVLSGGLVACPQRWADGKRSSAAGRRACDGKRFTFAHAGRVLAISGSKGNKRCTPRNPVRD